MPGWLHDHQALAWTVAASVALALVASLAGAIAIVRLPADYFAKPHVAAGGPWGIARNLAGWLLIVAGVAMLLLPGPGTIILLLGVLMANFPGKTRVQRWLLSRGPVLKSANRLRARFAKPLSTRRSRRPATTSRRAAGPGSVRPGARRTAAPSESQF